MYKLIPLLPLNRRRLTIAAVVVMATLTTWAPIAAQADDSPAFTITIGDGKLTTASNTTATYTVTVTEATEKKQAKGTVVASIPIGAKVTASTGGTATAHDITWPLTATMGKPQVVTYTVKVGDIPPAAQRIAVTASVFEGSQTSKPTSSANDYDVNTGYRAGASGTDAATAAPVNASHGSAFWFWIAAGVVLFVVIVGLLTYLIRRRRSDKRKIRPVRLHRIPNGPVAPAEGEEK